jgi:hypothetical protein
MTCSDMESADTGAPIATSGKLVNDCNGLAGFTTSTLKVLCVCQFRHPGTFIFNSLSRLVLSVICEVRLLRLFALARIRL